jgi:hypothetical protein
MLTDDQVRTRFQAQLEPMLRDIAPGRDLVPALRSKYTAQSRQRQIIAATAGMAVLTVGLVTVGSLPQQHAAVAPQTVASSVTISPYEFQAPQGTTVARSSRSGFPARPASMLVRVQTPQQGTADGEPVDVAGHPGRLLRIDDAHVQLIVPLNNQEMVISGTGVSDDAILAMARGALTAK